VWGSADKVGQFAKFQHGSIYWSPSTGARSMTGAIDTLYSAAGAERSSLGYPTQSVWGSADKVGQFAKFQHGSIYWSPTTGARSLTGGIDTLYAATGAEHSSLGYPTQSVWGLPDGVGRFAEFQGGSIYWSPNTGAQALSGPVRDIWVTQGAERGPLGYPTKGTTTAADGVSQYADFQNGLIYRSSSATETLTGSVRDTWVATGADRGPLGAPISSSAATTDGVGQFATFTGGSIYSSPTTGTHPLTGAIGTLYASGGAEQGSLGYPTSGVLATADGKGQYAKFQGGTVYWSPSTGARTMTGPVGSLYASAGAERSSLGYPTSDVRTAADGTGQYASFQGGTVYWSPSTGARSMMGAVGSLYASAGAERSSLGYPTQSVWGLPDKVGQFAKFQHGSIYWSPATGARSLTGAIGSRYASAGAQRSSLGYPTQSVWGLPDKVGQFAKFQHGSIYWSPTTAARIVMGSMLTTWTGSGAEHGALGYPTSEVFTVTGGSRQNFQHGYITVSTATGRATTHIN
jgi:uncharacterized protein with LGFP repeats